MTGDDLFKKLYWKAEEAYQKFGLSITIAGCLEPLLRDAGFTNVYCKAQGAHRNLGQGQDDTSHWLVPEDGGARVHLNVFGAAV
ncbi:hypothetical protein TOPH_04721 [Tolypocladium ophioglossoides CBS 100239]|uniref:Uncharacterized protein n=1 Tax=Tolypocladium ophioglossoides (strain CBS 100239) TaxID=1163406 RepID=A0A0L0N944_TOLOC|nr:hypothetical protein TOPH_04721 [Tolypocladium ophioglossoides CBS 100239]